MLKTSTSHFYQTQTKIFTKRINASTRACSTMISVRRESLRRWRRHLPLQTAGMCALQQDSSLSGGLASASSPLYLSYDAQYRTLGCVIITAWLQLICILKKACIYPQFNYLLQPTLKHFYIIIQVWDVCINTTYPSCGMLHWPHCWTPTRTKNL